MSVSKILSVSLSHFLYVFSYMIYDSLSPSLVKVEYTCFYPSVSVMTVSLTLAIYISSVFSLSDENAQYDSLSH